jgi:hypothetical protein
MFDAPIYICVQNMAFRIVIGMSLLQKADLSTTETTEIAETKSNFIFQ